MASEQARREKVTDDQRKIEKDRVPKITSHFESLAEGRQERQQQQQGPSLEEISNLRATAQHNSTEAIRAAEERYHKAKESSQTAGSHQQHAEGEQGKNDAASKGGAMKDDTAGEAKAPDVLMISSKGQPPAAAEKAKDASYSKMAAEFIGEKAAAAMDVTLESGKGAAGYAGKVASGVKGQAVVAGWGATHYTLEKVAEATKGAADLTSSVAGYTKDAVVATEEKAANYAARKKAEAQKDLEGKNELSQEQRGINSSVKEDYFDDEGEQKQQEGEGGADQFLEGEQKASSGSGTGTVFQAIGETIIEIGQTTKDLLVGPTGRQHDYPVDQLVEKEHKEN